MSRRLLCRAIAIVLSCFVFAATQSARADIPDELYKALKLSKDASPKQVYDAIVKRYYDPKQGHGKGAFADLWEPTPFTRYLEPKTLYVAPDMDFDVKRSDCVECHSSVTPGWVHSWQKSVHGNLDEIRSLPAKDSRSANCFRWHWPQAAASGMCRSVLWLPASLPTPMWQSIQPTSLSFWSCGNRPIERRLVSTPVISSCL